MKDDEMFWQEFAHQAFHLYDLIRFSGHAALIELGKQLATILVEIGHVSPRPDAPYALTKLTAREREVFAAFVDGLTVAETAQSLGIAEGTVRTHRTNLYRKLNVKSRAQLYRVRYPRLESGGLC